MAAVIPPMLQKQDKDRRLPMEMRILAVCKKFGKPVTVSYLQRDCNCRTLHFYDALRRMINKGYLEVSEDKKYSVTKRGLEALSTIDNIMF